MGRKPKPKVWEKNPISKDQKKSLMICPHCKRRFDYWQNASKHAEENKHYGDYKFLVDEAKK